MLCRSNFILLHVVNPIRQVHSKFPIGCEAQTVTKNVHCSVVFYMFMEVHIMEIILCLQHCFMFHLLDSGSGEQSYIVP